MSSFQIFAVVTLVTVWYILACRSDPAEGSRLLEEAFRDYDKRIRPNYGGSPVVVNVSLHLLSLPKIDTLRMTFQLSFFIRQTWIDPRFFFNSRRNIDTIMLDAITSERIWSPDTYFVNELSSVNHDILVKNQFCRISQNGTVLLSRRVTLTAFVNMDSNGSQLKDMKYQWAEDAVSKSTFETPEFTIGSILPTESSLTTSTGSYSRLTIRIEAKRNSLAYELGFMLPTSLLSLLCWCSMWSKNKSLGALVAIYLVSLMVLMNGILLLSSFPLLSPLQLYSLLSCAFGLICFIANLRSEGSGSSFGRNCDEIAQSKSRTESTSENCKIDDLPYGASLDNNHGQFGVASGQQNSFVKCMGQGRSKGWENFMRCVTLNSTCSLTQTNYIDYLSLAATILSSIAFPLKHW